MRSAFITGDGYLLELGCDIDIVYDALHHPKARAVDAITTEAKLTGKEVKEFLVEHKIPVPEEIKDDDEYVLHGCDW